MSLVDELTHVSGPLRDAMRRVWAKVEDAEYQQRIERDRAVDDQAARDDAARRRVPELRRRRVPQKFAELLAGGELSETVAVEAYRALDRHVLVLAGNPGCGKTVAASIAVDEGGPSSRFVSSVELARLGRAVVDRLWLEELESAAALALDDLGVETDDAKQTFRSRLDHLLAVRCANGRRTVITTNLDHAEFREAYGDRIWSRLHESGRFQELGAQRDLRFSEPDSPFAA